MIGSGCGDLKGLMQFRRSLLFSSSLRKTKGGGSARRVRNKMLEKDCMNQIRSLLSMHRMLLGYSFEPRPKSRMLATAGSVMTIGLSINLCIRKKITVWREKTRLTSPDDWPAASSAKVGRDLGRASISPPNPRRQREALLAGWEKRCFRKTLHESNKIFVEHAQHFARK